MFKLLFRQKKQRVLLPVEPHQKYPEILQWKKGDIIEGIACTQMYYFSSVTSDGILFLEDFKTKIMVQKDLAYIMESYYNSTCSERLVRDLEQQYFKKEKYMQFIQDFQKSYEDVKHVK